MFYAALKQARRGETFGLPGYVWDERVMRYRDLATGRFVARDKIVNLLRVATDEMAERFTRVAELAAQGEIPPALFQEVGMMLLKRLHLMNAALGAGGWDKLTYADLGHIGATLRMEYRYLARFARQVAEGKVKPGQAALRARLYIGKAFSAFWHTDRRRQEEKARRRGKRLLARWVTVGDPLVCPDCVYYESLGWQPLDRFPRPGDGHTQCLGNCRCAIEYKEVHI